MGLDRSPAPAERADPHRRTGGVSLKNAADFITAGAFAIGVGADLVDLAALRRGEASAITEKARQYVAAVAAAREPI